MLEKTSRPGRYLNALSHKVRRREWWFSRLFRIVTYILLFDLAFIFLYPFIYMVINSLKSLSDLDNMKVDWILTSLHFQNYVNAFKSLKYPTTFLNSVFVTAFATLGHTFGAAFIAYGLSRYKFKGRGIIFALVILTIIVPTQTIISPIYLLYSKIGFVGSPIYAGLTVPTFLGFGLKGGLFIFIFYTYFQTLPKAIEEASMIDGAGSFKTFFRIIVPTSSSAFLTAIILSIIWHWNDSYEPSFFITTDSRYLLPQMLPSLYDLVEMAKRPLSLDMMQARIIYNDGVLMAATVLVVLPVLLVYIFFQSRFMEGIERSGITGE